QRVSRVGDGLALGALADQDFAVVGVRNDGRRGARALGVFQHFDLVAIHDGNTRVGGTEVDADDFAHLFFLQKILAGDELGFRAISTAMIRPAINLSFYIGPLL